VDCEGKSITYNNCEYLIGRYVGSGAEGIVHDLINIRSGLCFFVIKIWRDSTPEHVNKRVKSMIDMKVKLNAVLKEQSMPDFIVVVAQGGVFEILYRGMSDETSNVYSILCEAEDAITHSRFRDATPLYQQVLRNNPHHTIALAGIAICQKLSGESYEALVTMSRVIDIEPNFLLYKQLYINYAADCGRIYFSIRQFEKMKSQYRYYHELDELGIRLYLASGRPEDAKKLYEENTALTKTIDRSLG
jgi:tetratricopeptide (TPR) repeat protein